MNSKIMALAIATLAGTVFAQPAVFTDLGNRTATEAFTQSVATEGGGTFQWFRIELPAVVAADGWVDVWLTPTASPVPATDMADSEIAMYNNAGGGASTLWNDDDDGSTTSRGATTFTGLGNGALRNGRDGPLGGGIYWIAVGRYDVTWATGFTATSNYTGAQNTVLLNFDISPSVLPYPPSGSGAASPSAAVAGLPVLLTVAVTAGGNPTNTAIVVSGDLSTLGGSATQAFFDNGTNGDVTAGDGTYSYSYTIPAATAEGAFTLPFTVTDGLERSSNGTIALSVDGAGATLETANVPVGEGELTTLTGSMVANDVDIFKINICDLANFTATTFGNGNTADTRLFLFSPDGMGVTYNDDVPDGFPGDASLQSRISNVNVTTAGEYYLAITRYQIMASDASAANIWVTAAPFNLEPAPNGAGAANPLAQWTGAAVTQTAVNYTIALTGACYPTTTPVACSEADIGIAGGLPGQDNLLDNNDFIAFINYFFALNPIADMGIAGGLPGADGQWDNNDFIAFINHFFADAANCTG
jgi:hypothetical protein